MVRLESSGNRKQKSLHRAQQSIHRAAGSWRKTAEYNEKRDGIKGTLTERNGGVGREVWILKRLMGVEDGDEGTCRDALTLRDLQTAKMSELLRLNRRNFGQMSPPAELKYADLDSHKAKKIHKFKSSSDKAMLRREIVRFHREDFPVFTPKPRAPRLRPSSRCDKIQLEDPEFEALSPLNQFIFRQSVRFTRKGGLKAQHRYARSMITLTPAPNPQ